MGDYSDNRPSTFILEKAYIYTRSRKIDKIDDWFFFRGNRPSTPFPQVKGQTDSDRGGASDLPKDESSSSVSAASVSAASV